MRMTKLHEKKISELYGWDSLPVEKQSGIGMLVSKQVIVEPSTRKDKQLIESEHLKEWAIAVVRWYCEYHNIKPFTKYWDIGSVMIKDSRRESKNMPFHNDAITIIKFLINRFELTESDLNEKG